MNEGEKVRLLNWLGNKLRADGLIIAYVDSAGTAYAQSWTPEHPVQRARIETLLKAARQLTARIEVDITPQQSTSTVPDESRAGNVRYLQPR